MYFNFRFLLEAFEIKTPDPGLLIPSIDPGLGQCAVTNLLFSWIFVKNLLYLFISFPGISLLSKYMLIEIQFTILRKFLVGKI